MAGYEFRSTWVLDAPREDVWDAIWDSERWPGWWPGLIEAVELDPGSPCGIGRRGRYTWRSLIPYPVRFEVRSTEVVRPTVLAGEASGDLEGVGRWTFEASAGATTVSYLWTVRTTKAWMNAIAPLAGPVFRWNHDYLMRRGGVGLARMLGVRLIAGDQSEGR